MPGAAAQKSRDTRAELIRSTFASANAVRADVRAGRGDLDERCDRRARGLLVAELVLPPGDRVPERLEDLALRRDLQVQRREPVLGRAQLGERNLVPRVRLGPLWPTRSAALAAELGRLVVRLLVRGLGLGLGGLELGRARLGPLLVGLHLLELVAPLGREVAQRGQDRDHDVHPVLGDRDHVDAERAEVEQDTAPQRAVLARGRVRERRVELGPRRGVLEIGAVPLDVAVHRVVLDLESGVHGPSQSRQ